MFDGIDPYDLAADLEAIDATLADIEAETAPAPPRDAEDANRKMRALARTEKELSDISDLFETEHARLYERQKDLSSGLEHRVEFLTDTLCAWLEANHRDQEEAGQKLTPSIKLPAGVVKSTAGRRSSTITDPSALETWIEENKPELVETVRKYPTAAALAKLYPDLITEEGELIPGVETNFTERSYKVVPE